MADSRLSALDASFLDVETPTAHMHVGWTATFARPVDGRACGFAAIRDHIVARLDRAPRYRQRLADVPLDIDSPVWVEDEDFDPERHVLRAPETTLGDIAQRVMSQPLDRARPLWEMWIADELADGTIGLVGKAHHCMVDGLAAVELATLLLDPTPEPPRPQPRRWLPAPPPGGLELVARAAAGRARQTFDAAAQSARLAGSPALIARLPAAAARAAGALAGSLLPLAPPSPFNRPGSPQRQLATARRPLDDLRRIKREFGTTVNDVLLAAAAGALRRLMEEHGDRPQALKVMVPVSVRDVGDELGNRISFMFAQLPCDEPNAVSRLRAIHAETARRKRAGEPEHAGALLDAAGFAPRPLQHLLARVVASPRVFNLVVSNVPGPREPLFMNGCELLGAYPVVPLADDHALSIGMTTVRDDACFGVYADSRTLPDAELAARYLDDSIDELLVACTDGSRS